MTQGMTNAQAALIAAALSVKFPPIAARLTRPEWELTQHDQSEAWLRRASAGLLWLNNEDRKQAKRNADMSPDMSGDTRSEGTR